MKSNSFIVLITLVILVLACNRTQNPEPQQESFGNRTSDILLSYYNFSVQQADGTFGLQHSNTMPMQDVPEQNSRSTDASAAFRDSNGLPTTSGIEEVKIDDFMLNAGEDNIFINNKNADLSVLYGKNAVFSFKKQKVPQNENLYLPKLLRLDANFNTNTYTVPVSAGTTIRWNKDDLNTKGVVVVLDYNPKTNPNEIAQSYPTPKAKAIGTEDTGSYTFSQNDLADFPNGASVILT
ncbi:MAG: hypothetical protein ACK40K_05325, partial [Raineya sp.]